MNHRIILADPTNPAEGWSRHIGPNRPQDASDFVDVVGADMTIETRIATSVHWDSEPSAPEYWRPWRELPLSIRERFNDGSFALFSSSPTVSRQPAVISKLLRGEIGAIEVKTSAENRYIVERDGLLKLEAEPMYDREKAENGIMALASPPCALLATPATPPFASIAEEVIHLRRRETELMESSNRYLDESRTAKRQFDQLTGATQKAVTIAENRQKENDTLRLIIANTATALGASILPTDSITFMGKLPYEASIKMQLHRQNLGAYQARENNTLEQLRAYGITLMDARTMSGGVNLLGQRLRRAADAASAAGCVLSSSGSGWIVPTKITSEPGTRFTVGSWETPEGGVIRLELWPAGGGGDGYVLWYHGEIAWRSHPPTAQAKPAKREVTWIRGSDARPHEITNLMESSAVLIRTENGIWRTKNERGGGNGYTYDPDEADTWTGLEAWKATDHCGPEKEVQFGIIL